MANGDPKFTWLDERIYKNVQPLGYSTKLSNILPAIGNTIVGGGRKPAGERREDMWRYALGGREPSRSFNKSKYTPSISRERGTTYYTPKDYDKKKFLNKALKTLRDRDRAVIDTREGSISELPYLTFAGDMTVGKGEDERGQYVSFYDKWDLKNPLANKFLDRQPEIYDRVYYEKGSDNNYVPVEQNDNKNNMNKVKYRRGGLVGRQDMQLPEYNYGGSIAQGALAGAGTGAALGPWGAAGGALIGGVGGFFQEQSAQDQQADQQRLIEQQQAAQAMPQQQFQSPYISPYQMARGGRVGTNAELERGETYMTPTGTIKQMPKGTPTHARGGQPMNLPVGTQVLGDLKNSNDERYKDLGRRLEKAYNNYNKILKGTSTPIAKRTAEKMLAKVQKEYMDLMSEQESQKAAKGNRKMQEGGNIGAVNVTGDASLYNAPEAMYGMPTTYDVDNPQLAPMSSPQGPEQTTPGSFLGNLGENTDWGKVGTGVGMAAQFAPALYNIGRGIFGKEADTQAAYQENPYKQEVLNLMRDRTYDVRPQMAQANIASRTARRNLRETASSPAQYMANLAGVQGQEARSKAEILGQKENIENQYRQQQAQLMQQMGGTEAQRRQQLQEANLDRRLRSQAAKDRLLSTGLSQLGAGSRGVMQDVQSRRNTEMLRGVYNQLSPNFPISQQGNIGFNPGDPYTLWKRRSRNNNR